ncbi:MAG: ATP-binding cassette domain-containing protein [Gammaproteobacteria bacterium]|jgi:ABC-type glutathione transport system ATPase component|nr:ATP-binding cassette domain-containing protein [Gammaproteobacteria bacterium]
MTQPLLELRGVAKLYSQGSGLRALWPGGRQQQMALAPTDLVIPDGAAIGLVGESGSGKTTLSRIAAGLSRPSRGEVDWQGTPIEALDPEARAAWRRELQYVFQNATAALNPRHRVRRILHITLAGLWRGSEKQRDQAGRHERINEVAAQVGLGRVLLDRYPHQLSGGQAQRVAIARALLGAPKLLILDEPVSALDLSLQAQILNLLVELRRDLGLTYLFISHDLAVVERLCDEVHVMHDGRIIEQGATAEVLSNPRKSYTRRLLAAVPRR